MTSSRIPQALGAERAASLFDMPRQPVLGGFVGPRRHGPGEHGVDHQGRVWFTSAGRSAIFHALKAFGVGPGDSVWVPTYHCPTMIEPLVLLGAQPRFYPIGAAGEVSLPFLRNAGPHGAKALLAAHFFGLPQDFSTLRRFCDEHGIALLEDCAHAYFGHGPAGAVGGIGDAAIASLPKFFAATDGGCLVLRKPGLTGPQLQAPSIAFEARAWWDALETGATAGKLGWLGRGIGALVHLKNRLRGRRPGTQAPAPLQEPDLHAACHTMDMPSTLRRASAMARWAVAHTDSTRLIAARRANFERFLHAFRTDGAVQPLIDRLPDGAVPYVFPLQARAGDPLYGRLRARGVPMFRWDLVWPGTPTLAGDSAPAWWRRVIQLPCHQDLSARDVDAMVDAIRAECRACEMEAA